MSKDSFDIKSIDEKTPLPDKGLVEYFRDPEKRSARVREVATAMRARVRELNEVSSKGRRVTALLTAITDQIVASLFTALVDGGPLEKEPICLLAMGGYGRRELSPYSDLDLLLLHGEKVNLGAFSEDFLYPLWDAGFDVQSVTRTVKENISVSREDIRSRSSLLEARLIFGDKDLSADFFRRVVEGDIFGKGVKRFLRAKLDEMDARHSRFGDTLYITQPNLKDGQGGLRDIQMAFWAAKLRLKVSTVDEMFGSGELIPPEEIRALEESRDFLIRVRNFLHFSSGRREDRLGEESQEDAARFFGYEDSKRQSAAAKFMMDFYRHTSRVKHFADVVIRRSCHGIINLRPGKPSGERRLGYGITFKGGELLLSPEMVKENPYCLIKVFEEAQSLDAPLAPQALEVVRANRGLIDERFRRDNRVVESFLKILKHPRRVATTLLWMHDVRFLDALIPEFAPLFCRVTHELNHIYTVDVHSLFTVTYLRRLARGEYRNSFPLVTSVMEKVKRHDILYLAALLHDVGKDGSGNHPEHGAQIALGVGGRMGLAGEELEVLVFLVRNHLLISSTAQGRDLADDELIGRVSEFIGSEEMLDLLFLLTFADISAVGEGVLNDWKMSLIAELYHKVRGNILRESVKPPSIDKRAGMVKERLASIAVDEGLGDFVDEFITGVDHPRYLLTYPATDLMEHLALFARKDSAPLMQVRRVEGENHSIAMILSKDHPGLFAEIAGVTAASGVNIISANLTTRRDGWALDILHVTGPGGERLEDERKVARWRKNLLSYLGDEREDEIVPNRQMDKIYRGKKPHRIPPPKIRFDNEASTRFTVVDIEARDRLGLLYDISRGFSSAGLTIRLARIATTLVRADDSFYVERVTGGKVTQIGEIAFVRQILQKYIKEGYKD